MTGAEMVNGFKFGYDKLDTLQLPNLLEAEVYLLLNQAQDSYQKLIWNYLSSKNKATRSFDSDTKRKEDLSKAVSSVNIAVAGNSFTKPGDYFLSVSEIINISYPFNGSTINKSVEPDMIDYDLKAKVKEAKDPFYRPAKDKVYILNGNNVFEVFHNQATTILSMDLDYIKILPRITAIQSCELSEHTHQEIINIAIIIALEGIESPRLQSFEMLRAITEE